MSFLRRGKNSPAGQPQPGGVHVALPVVLSDKGAYGDEGPSSLDATARRAPRPNDAYAPPVADAAAAEAAAAAARAAATPSPEPPSAPARSRSVAPPGA